MKILAIDTSSKSATVAITENEEKLIELNNADEKTHSQKLMVMIDKAFKQTNLQLDDIGLIARALGPGSFTGVRIGIATAKAFADSKNIPTAGVNSLEELAYNLNTEGYIGSLIDAGHGNVYAGFFKIEKDKTGKLQTVKEDLKFLNLKDENDKISENKLIEFIESNVKNGSTEYTKTSNSAETGETTVHFVGDATVIYEELFENLKTKVLYEIKLANASQTVASGITLAQLGYTKYKNGQYGNSAILKPVYLRKSQAELALEEKGKIWIYKLQKCNYLTLKK